MFSTTVLLAVQMRYVKHLPVVIAIGYFVIYGFLDGEYSLHLFPCLMSLTMRCEGLFWGAALKKVPQGAWVPLIIGVVM